MNQREKAARKVQARITEIVGYPFTLPPSRNELADAYSKLAIDLQVAVDEAVELMRETFDYYCGPHASGSLTCNCNSCGLCEMRSKLADWLSRNERKEV